MKFDEVLAKLIDVLRESGISATEAYGVVAALEIVVRVKVVGEFHEAGKAVLKAKEDREE